MTRLGFGVLGGFVVVSLACMGSTRSGQASTGAGSGSPTASAEDTGQGKGSAQQPEAASAAPGEATAGNQATASSAQPSGAPRQVEGRIERIDRADDVTLAGTESAGHAFDKLKLDDGTQVTIDGEKASVDDLDEGDQVRASFSEKDGELHLDKVDVVTPSNE